MDIFNFLFRVTQRPPSVRPTEEGNRRRSLLCLFILLFFWHSSASAADYYWSYVGGAKYSNALDACKARFPAQSNMRIIMGFQSTYAQCIGSPSGYVGDVTRHGDSCPSGTEFNPETGACVAPPNPCESTNGQTILHQHKMKESVGQPSTEPPGSVCANSCQYVWGFTPATNVYAYTDGDPPGVFGSYEYTSAGFQCVAADTPREAPAAIADVTNPDDTPPPDDTSQCPTGYTFNGTFCSPDTPTEPTDPTDPTDPTEPTDPTHPGGGGGSDDGSGDGGSDGSTGDGGGSGDGSGDGFGQCDPATDPNKCVISSVGGEACSSSLVCTGDAIQCALLRQQKAMRCEAEKQADYESQKANIENMFKGDKFEVDEQEVEIPGFINTATRFLPAACPNPLTASTSGGTFGYSFEPVCELASNFSWIFVAMAALWAAVYVGAAAGGNE